MAIIKPGIEVRAGEAQQELEGVSRWTVAQQAGTMPKQCSIQVAGMPDSLTNLSVWASYDNAPATPLIEQAEVVTESGELKQAGYFTTVQAVDGADALIKLAPEKTIIYLAREYIEEHAKGLDWELDKDGHLVMIYGGQIWPLRIPEVPHKDADQIEDTYEIVIIQNDLEEVLQDLAARIDIAIQYGCPKTPFRYSYTLQQSQTFFDAIRDLVSIWNPLLTMDFDAGVWTLFVLDVEAGQYNQTGGMSFTQRELVVSNIRQQKQRIVNRATIHGAERTKEWAYATHDILAPPRKPIALSPDYVVKREILTDQERSEPIENMPSWTEHHVTKLRKEYARDPNDVNNRILIREEIVVLEYESQWAPVISKKVTTYNYLDYTAATSENLEEWQRVRLPGQALPTLQKIKEVKTEFGDFVDYLGEVERNVVEYGYIVCDFWQPDYGNPQYRNPQEAGIAIANQTIDLSSNSGQSYIWGQIRRHQVRYEVEDIQRVRRDTMTFHNITGQVEMDSEYIPIDYNYRIQRRNEENQARWDFKDDESIAENGYRPTVEITFKELREDEDDVLAEELWERIKRRSGAMLIEAQIVLPAWTPALIGERVIVKEEQVKKWDLAVNDWKNQILPEGEYYVTGIQHNYEANAQTGEARITTTLSLKSTF